MYVQSRNEEKTDLRVEEKQGVEPLDASSVELNIEKK